MSKELIFLLAQPDDMMFRWQIEVQVNSWRKYGLSDKIHYLMFLPSDRMKTVGWNKETRELPLRYPECHFYWYEDVEDILIKFVQPYQYIPLLRPYCLARHFKEYPELKDKAIFYLDSDVIWTRDPTEWLNKYKDDDISYLSDTRSYLGVEYWDSKIKDVREDKLEQYKLIDPLNVIAMTVGITRETCVKNDAGAGGAQYLLKNIDHTFWLDVFRSCLSIRGSLSYHVPGSINNTYFSDENKGFQSWTADMWAVIWNLWKRNQATVCPPEMDFAWATDKIEKWERVYIYHDAGAGARPIMVEDKEHALFYKKGRNGEYVNNRCTPFEDKQHLIVSPEYCSSMYCKEIEETRVNREFSVILK
jgi:hypothetical protein